MSIQVAIICGGQSPEHEISLLSAKNVIHAINKEKFSLHIIYIEKNGTWKYAGDNFNHIGLNTLKTLCIIPGSEKFSIALKDDPTQTLEIDIVFPVLHGANGEDGTIQGLLKLCNLPFVGSNALGSAISMNKDVIKRLLRDAGIRVANFLTYHHSEKSQIDFDHIVKTLKLPFFIKPNNTGSSIGVNKVKSKTDFMTYLNAAFQYDQKVIIEEFIEGREIECAVLGNENPIVALPGEIIPHHEFYSYEAKYIDANGASVVVPANLDATFIQAFQSIAKSAFKTLCCSGMARVDFFLSKDNTIYVNEINTIPGFTNISMYPKCWQASHVSYADLIEKLIFLGLKEPLYEMAS